jgi:hypothetical protein
MLQNMDIFTNKDHGYSLILFHLDLIKKKVNIKRAGNDLNNIFIKPEFTFSQYGFNTERPAVPPSVLGPSISVRSIFLSLKIIPD